jgi:hypothetical protein
MLKNFYTSYINQFSNPDPQLTTKNLKNLQKKYCTTNLLSKIAKANMDGDPFIKGQDLAVSALKTLDVKRDTKGQNSYIVSWGSSTKKIIHLTVVKETDGFKIDSVN